MATDETTIAVRTSSCSMTAIRGTLHGMRSVAASGGAERSLVPSSSALASPLSIAVVGHTYWAFGPSYVKIRAGDSVRVTNVGGRDHTFTEVAQFGGGNVPLP